MIECETVSQSIVEPGPPVLIPDRDEAKDKVAEFWNDPASQVAQRKFLDAAVRGGLKTIADVKAMITWLKDPVISTQRICANEDHASPFQYVSDVMLGKVQDYIVWANRAGSKSYLAGMITWIQSALNPRLETNILGGSFEQSEKSYKAMNDFWMTTRMQDEWLMSDPSRQKTVWKNRSQVSVLTASTKSTRGPHPQHLILDEIDEMDESVYRAALSQPQGKHGIRASLGRLSTNHQVAGVMDIALALAKETGTKVYKWCVFECMESCRDHSCSTCKIAAYCPGLQMKTANGYYQIEDFVQKLYNMSAATVSLEWLCVKVGRSDLVYVEEYDQRVIAPREAPDFNPSLPALISIDWGGTVPFSLGVWQAFPDRWWRVDEIYMPGTTNQVLLKEAKMRPWWGNIPKGPKTHGGIADPGRSDLIKEWADHGINLVAADNGVDMGIEAVRNSMKPVMGPPRFGVNPRRCHAWMIEVMMYRVLNGKPVKKNDHAMDETRYFVVWKVAARPSRRGKVHAPESKSQEREGMFESHAQ